MLERFNIHPDDLESTRALFAEGGPAFGKPFLDDDWLRIYPDMTFEIHELCTGCQLDGTCPFHKVDINTEEEYTAAFTASMPLCDCENSHCKVGHALGGCERPATTPVMYGTICAACLNYMPREYLA